MKINFYNDTKDELIRFSVIVSRHGSKWVFCKHKERTTLEVPGGHREKGETPLQTAERELREETGALTYDISPVCVYSVTDTEKGSAESFGMLYYAEIYSFEEELHSEMESICFLEEMPVNWTYPLIQPRLIEEVIRRKELK